MVVFYGIMLAIFVICVLGIFILNRIPPHILGYIMLLGLCYWGGQKLYYSTIKPMFVSLSNFDWAEFGIIFLPVLLACITTFYITERMDLSGKSEKFMKRLWGDSNE